MRASSPTSSSGPRRQRSSGRWFRLVVGLSVTLGIAGYLLLHHLTSSVPEGCTVRASGEEVDLRLDQAANATTIAAVASSRGMPERAVAIAIATSMQESKLENITYGDRDSLGLFQQRPSQGWGTARQIMDPVYATNAFFTSLEKIPGYSRLPLTVAAQKVQKSGYPQAYAKHEAESAALAAALSGREPGALRCTVHSDQAGSAAAVPGDVSAVGKRVTQEFADSAGRGQRAGRTLSFPSSVRAARGAGDPAGDRHGWALAHWAVAHAKELRIERVAFRGRQWTAAKSDEGWRKSSANRSEPVSVAVGGASNADGVRISVVGK
ncbi:movement TGBp3 family protein [Wenjunlia tyrosinilytica]|uniref:ARB-07466-like C-terminal domain-containing protein n=1 Tax=Wenjunlia tyrosinilytica TaxID=1544741 RepID=A0A917ZLL4_9ACTN|nr:movement TGBp3 family protein [Wenjunlia tyrosinilytica]GGO85942.1 hypothetical protein GCM10012280_20900 [Wenjunlia tyrosinilytica]